MKSNWVSTKFWSGLIVLGIGYMAASTGMLTSEFIWFTVMIYALMNGSNVANKMVDAKFKPKSE